MIVHQILSGAGPVDAVTGQARGFRELFERWGWGGHDFAEHIDPRMDGAIKALRALDPDPQDILLVHYSAYASRLRRVLSLPNRKLLLSHNVTPARWFWDYDPQIAIRCALGRRHLGAFVKNADLVAAVSRFNAEELGAAGAEETTVIPLLFDTASWGPPPAGPPAGAPTVLFVGRLTPHKRQDEVIRAFELYRHHRAPDARLVLVGEPLNRAYRTALAELAHQVSPGAVTIESGLPAAALADRYRQAHAFLCLSEHEGFCLPLLEAFHFGVPVIARPVGGIPEVVGDGALLVEDGDLAVVSELLHLAVGDAELRAELRERGRARLAQFTPEHTATQLREALETVAAMRPAQAGAAS
jgi:glycosyltransferase involved in cell wall biosynthesis